MNHEDTTIIHDETTMFDQHGMMKVTTISDEVTSKILQDSPMRNNVKTGQTNTLEDTPMNYNEKTEKTNISQNPKNMSLDMEKGDLHESLLEKKEKAKNPPKYLHTMKEDYIKKKGHDHKKRCTLFWVLKTCYCSWNF